MRKISLTLIGSFLFVVKMASASEYDSIECSINDNFKAVQFSGSLYHVISKDGTPVHSVQTLYTDNYGFKESGFGLNMIFNDLGNGEELRVYWRYGGDETYGPQYIVHTANGKGIVTKIKEHRAISGTCQRVD